MSSLAVARAAIASEIKSLAAQRTRLEAALRSLDADQGTDTPPKARKALKGRLRLKGDVAADITSKVVKAVKAHREGASRKDILTYLGRSGYHVGHHYNEPHLSKIVTTLLGSDTPPIRREGDKGSTRYFTA